ncbi:MAG: hypothetical protein LBM94_05495 [Propionibacteriaceae bacterium]|jgi:hypothetical protein|nr:hypothetical protein [Propionibacteriaceae bacterium]
MARRALLEDDEGVVATTPDTSVARHAEVLEAMSANDISVVDDSVADVSEEFTTTVPEENDPQLQPQDLTAAPANTAAPRWLFPLAVFASWLVSLAILYWQTRNVDFTLPMQNYDSATHNELVRGMLNRRSISPFGFQDSLDLYGTYYPLGFTSLAYVFVTWLGVSVPTGISLAWGVGAAILWPLGCAFLVRALLPHRIFPAALAPVVSMCFEQYPLGLLNFGTLYPYALASSLLPWLLGATVWFARKFFPRQEPVVSSRPSSKGALTTDSTEGDLAGVSPVGTETTAEATAETATEPTGIESTNAESADVDHADSEPASLAVDLHCDGSTESESSTKIRFTWGGFPWWPMVGVVISGGLAAYVQPRTGLIYVLVVTPFLVNWWYRRFWRDNHTRLITKAWLPLSLLAVVGSAITYAYLRFGDRLFDTSQWKLTPAVMNWPHAIGLYLSGSGYVDSTSDIISPSWVMTAMVIVALVAVAWMCPDQRWLLVGWLLIGFVFCCAAAGEELLPRIVSLPWYRQELRVYAAYPLVMVPIICVGFDVIVRLISGFAGKVAGAMVAAVVVAGSLAGDLTNPGVVATADSIVATSSQPGGLLDAAKHPFYQECVPVVGEDMVAADPWSGAMFAFSQYNINQHFNTLGPQSRHWDAILTAGRGNLSQLRDFGVVWVMDLGPIWNDFDPVHESFWTFHNAEKYSGLEAVLSVWDPYINYNLTLYRILPPT